jgi:hypothetical protein
LPRTALVKCYLLPTEKARLHETARQLGLSTSTLAQKLLTGQDIHQIAKNHTKAVAVLDLLKINADLARLGNLFKLAITEGIMATDQAYALAEEILNTQFMLREKINDL